MLSFFLLLFSFENRFTSISV